MSTRSKQSYWIPNIENINVSFYSALKHWNFETSLWLFTVNKCNISVALIIYQSLTNNLAYIQLTYNLIAHNDFTLFVRPRPNNSAFCRTLQNMRWSKGNTNIMLSSDNKCIYPLTTQRNTHFQSTNHARNTNHTAIHSGCCTVILHSTNHHSDQYCSVQVYEIHLCDFTCDYRLSGVEWSAQSDE